MDKQLLGTIITGCFSLAAALGSVWLKEALERRRLAVSPTPAPRLPDGARPAAAHVPRWNWTRPLLLFLGGFVVGVIARAVRPPYPYEWIFVAIVAALVLTSAVTHRRTVGGLWAFELENLALWSAWATGWSVVHRAAWDDVIVSAAIFWLSCALLGLAVVLPGAQRRATN